MKNTKLDKDSALDKSTNSNHFSEQQLKDLMDDDIPRCSSETIQEWEIRNGRGFWGNMTTGYIYDNQNDY